MDRRQCKKKVAFRPSPSYASKYCAVSTIRLEGLGTRLVVTMVQATPDCALQLLALRIYVYTTNYKVEIISIIYMEHCCIAPSPYAFLV